MRSLVTRIQKKVGVKADGIVGPNTLAAICRALGISAQTPPNWPTQAEVRSGKSMFGAPGCEEDLVSIIPAYPLIYEGKTLRTIRVHRRIASHVQAALREVLAHYGREEIERLGLNLYGGSYAYRTTSGGNKSLSMHAWGIALDFSPADNAYATKAPRATLSHPDCAAWWDIWEAHGATSLGRERDYDWMHLQFAKLS